MLRMLLRPRYVALSALMLVIAIVCVGLGTWQIVRLEQKASQNDALRSNAHAGSAAVDDVLPLVGAPGAPPRPHKVQFRTVRVTGVFDDASQGFVRGASVNGDDGYLVMTPLRTAGGTLLVVRGFVASSSNTTPTVAAPPAGQVTVTARVQPADTRKDDARSLPARQLESINPDDQARRLGGPVYDGYAELLSNQPGTARLTAMPSPDLSNPAGGAVEPQHVAYIIQWYLFAMLAVAAPFAMIRAETRARDEDEVDALESVGAPGSVVAHGPGHDGPAPDGRDPFAEFDDERRAPDPARAAQAARMADRYGKVR